eukprot:38089-Amphidinium_carterae.1
MESLGRPLHIRLQTTEVLRDVVYKYQFTCASTTIGIDPLGTCDPCPVLVCKEFMPFWFSWRTPFRVRIDYHAKELPHH